MPVYLGLKIYNRKNARLYYQKKKCVLLTFENDNVLTNENTEGSCIKELRKANMANVDHIE